MSTPETEIKELVVPAVDVTPFLAPIAPFRERVEAAIAASKGITIAGHSEGEKAGLETCKELWRTLRDLRTKGVEATRIAMKRPVLDVGQAIDRTASEIVGIITPEENRLKKEIDDYEARKVEEKRKADKAKADLLAKRLSDAWERLKAGPGDLNMGIAQNGTDAAWEEHLLTVQRHLERQRQIEDRVNAFKSIGAVVPSDIGEWTEEEFSMHLDDAVAERKAKDEREKAEHEAEERRLLGQRRSILLDALGVEMSQEDASKLSAEEFEKIADKARQDRKDAQAKAKADAERLAEIHRQQEQEAIAAATKVVIPAVPATAMADIDSMMVPGRIMADERPIEMLDGGEHGAVEYWMGSLKELVEMAPIVEDPSLRKIVEEFGKVQFAALDELAKAIASLRPKSLEDMI